MIPGESHNEWYQYYCSNFFVFNTLGLPAYQRFVQTASSGLASVNEWEKNNMCDRYSCIIYLIPTKLALKTQVKYTAQQKFSTGW